jgi:excisionase family DNA binding protein
MKKFYNINEVAKDYEVSRRTVERLIKSGELQSFKFGDSRRIEAQELERLKKKEQSETD